MTTSPLPVASASMLDSAPLARRRVIRRRATPEQGRALELLGHAIEYLVDSSMDLSSQELPFGTGDIAEATGLLIRLNQQVFAECAEAVPLGRRLGLWFKERCSRRAATKTTA